MGQYIVRFKSPGFPGPVDTGDGYAGVDTLEALAQEAGINPEYVDNWAPRRSEKTVDIKLGFARAREIPPLRASGLVEVVVPGAFLNRFLVFRLVREYGRFWEPYRLCWEIDEEAVLKAWEKAGFPEEWGPEEEEEEG